MTRERALMLIVGVLAVSLVAVILGQNRTFVSAAKAAPPRACTDALLNGRCCFTEEGYLLTKATAFPQAVSAFGPAAGIGYRVANGHGNLTGTDIISVGGELVSRTTEPYSAVIDPNDGIFRSLQVSPTGAVFTVLGSKSSRVWLCGGHHG